MRKTLMAAAVAGALTAPGVAMAQTSTVQVFGTVHLLYQRQTNFRAANGDVPSLDHLTQSDSELGFRGEEALGGGLSAWFQCASSFDLVGTGGTAGDNAWCGRNSGMGMKGGFGNVFFGIWDTPEKLMIGPIRGWFGFANILGGVGNVLENGSQSGMGNPFPGVNQGNAGYARRQVRTINYHSPSWGGFGFMGAYSATNEATASTSATLANKARLWSAAATYNAGPIYAAVSYERHHNYNPTGVGLATAATPAVTITVPAGVLPVPGVAGGLAVPAQTIVTTPAGAAGTTGIGGLPGQYSGGNDHKWGIGGAYTFAGVAKLSGIYNWFKYDTTNTTTFKARTWAVFLDWTIAGPHSIKAAFTRLNDTKGSYGCGGTSGAVGSTVGLWTANCGGGSTGVQQYNLAYAYGFSKRTTGYIGFAHIDNESNARVQLPGGPRGLVAGEDFTVYGLGIRHSF